MDRNTIIGILLIGVIFIGYSYYNNNKLDKAYDKEISYADSLFIAEDYAQAILAYRKAQSFKPREQYPQTQISEINQTMGLYDNSPDLNTQSPDTTQEQDKKENISTDVSLEGNKTYQSDKERESQYGAFYKASIGEEKFITLENNLVKLVFTNKGGKLYSAELKEFQTHDTLPLLLFEGDSTVFGFQFFTVDNHPIETNNLFFTIETEKQTMLVEDQPVSFAMRLEAGDGKYIEYTYSLKPDEYMLDFDLKIVGLKETLARNLSALDLSWEMYMPQQEKGRINENNYAGIKFKYYQDEVDGSGIRANKDIEEFDVSTKLEWLAYKDQFFSTVLISDEPFLNGWVQSTKTEESERYIRFLQAKLSMSYKGDSDEAYKMHIYLGPNNFKLLKKYNLDLEKLVFLGKNVIRIINEFVIIQLFNWLNGFIGNYGLIILVLTVIIKMALFPLTFKSYQSQAKMRVLKPQVDAINDKFPKKEDAMKKQQATMALYKKVGVSPVGGCLPMMLQMPILFAMFRFFPTSIELRQESFLWAHDLSTYDSILSLPWDLPMYGDHVSLFTLLMTVSTILTMKINTPAQTGGAQMPGMKGMMYMMPVMFMLILNNFSAGLTYYYFLANLITFAQNMISKQFVNEEAVLKKLDAKKSKPVQKSKWQQRLESAAKQKGYKPSKKK